MPTPVTPTPATEPFKPRPKRFSRRNHALLSFGLLYAVYGYYLFELATVDRVGGIQAYADNLMPLEAWGAVWILCGMIAVAQSFKRYITPIAWVSLAAISWAWAGLALLALADGVGAVAYEVTSLAIWMLMADLVTLLAGWVDEQRMIP